MKHLKFILIYLSTLLLTTSAFGAEIFMSKENPRAMYGFGTSTSNSKRCYDEITINGDIISGDFERFVQAYRRFEVEAKKNGCWQELSKYHVHPRLSIRLNSKGGSVDEAIRIGSFIRDAELQTSVYVTDICFSSCVLIFAAGVIKFSFGNIGIHRPYFSSLSPSLSRSEIQAERNKITDKLKKYASKVDISASLIERMLSIPPESIVILNDNEKEFYRLVGYDASYDEKRVAADASYYNLTSSAYREKASLIERVCSYSDVDHMECSDSIYLNIPRSEVRRRIALSRSACLNLKGTTRIECVRNIRVFGKN